MVLWVIDALRAAARGAISQWRAAVVAAPGSAVIRAVPARAAGGGRRAAGAVAS